MLLHFFLLFQARQRFAPWPTHPPRSFFFLHSRACAGMIFLFFLGLSFPSANHLPRVFSVVCAMVFFGRISLLSSEILHLWSTLCSISILAPFFFLRYIAFHHVRLFFSLLFSVGFLSEFLLHLPPTQYPLAILWIRELVFFPSPDEFAANEA